MFIPEAKLFELAPEGQHLCVCTGVIDLGTQTSEYQGQTTTRRQVYIEWETADETDSHGERFRFGNFYTLSSHEKSNFRKDLEAWRGRPFKDGDFGPGGFQIESLLGAPAVISVAHVEKNGKDRLEVMSISSLMKGMTKPKTLRRIYFSMGDDEYSEDAFDAVPDGLKRIIERSPEWRDLNGMEPVNQDGDVLEDEIPF